MENTTENDVEMEDAGHDFYMSESAAVRTHFFPAPATQFDDLPFQLYNEIFKFLTIPERNKIREVAVPWDHAVKFAFGLKIILNNYNVQEMSSVNDIIEIQVRNLTRKLPESPSIKIFDHAPKVRNLEIMGMILSTNLLKLLTEFKNISTLKLSRVYLETDRLLRISDEVRENLPPNLTHLKMSFLKTFHHKNYLRFARGRNTSTDLYTLASSDNIILNLIQNFNLENLKTLQLYHSMSDDTSIKRHSEMISRIRSQMILQNQNENNQQNGGGAGGGDDEDGDGGAGGEMGGGGDGNDLFPGQFQNQFNHNLEQFQQDFESDGTRAISNILLKLFSNRNSSSTDADACAITHLKLDNLPQLILPEAGPETEGGANSMPTNLQFAHLELAGILGGGWMKILEAQVELKTLHVNLLDPNLMSTVKDAVRRCGNTLESLAIILGTPDALIPNNGGNNLNVQMLPQAEAAGLGLDLLEDLEDPNDFDTSFLADCAQLSHFKIYYAPRKIDLRYLPASLKSLELCGKIQPESLIQFLGRSPNLENLNLAICDGTQIQTQNRGDTTSQRQIFSQVSTLKSILENSSLATFIISEAGAFDSFKSFVVLSEELPRLKASLDFVEYRASALPLMLPPLLPGAGVHGIGPEDAERLTFVTVPRITISISGFHPGPGPGTGSGSGYNEMSNSNRAQIFHLQG